MRRTEGVTLGLFLFVFYFYETGFLCLTVLTGNSLCRPCWPRTHRDLPTFAFQVLGLKACATTVRPVLFCFVLFCFSPRQGLKVLQASVSQVLGLIKGVSHHCPVGVTLVLWLQIIFEDGGENEFWRWDNLTDQIVPLVIKHLKNMVRILWGYW